MEKQVFLWRAKKVHICCIFKWKSRFSRDAPKKVQICCIFKWKSRFSRDAPKRCKFAAFLSGKAGILWRAKKWKFVALLRGKSGFLVTRQKGANLLHYYVEKQVFSWRARKGANLLHYYEEKQVFSWRAKKVHICCIFKWKSRFSRDAPKRCKFVAFLSGKAGFLVTRQKGAHLLHF